MSGQAAFQQNGFQNSAFQVVQPQSILVVDTINKLQLPINCVVAGQQREPLKNAIGLNGITGPLRGIFGE